MKQLLFLIVLILVLGIGGFAYRYVMEQPAQEGVTACTMEARMCPDGTSVGRSGPDCSFAACAFPNIEMPNVGLSFALPLGYAKGVQEPGADGYLEGMLDFYAKPSLSPSVDHYITVYSYPIPAGQTADQVILAHTRYQPADMQAENFSRFTTKTINGKTFRSTVIERFEGQITSSYFLARSGDVLRFEVIERDVTNWTDANLVVENLPEHQALLKMLATLQTN